MLPIFWHRWPTRFLLNCWPTTSRTCSIWQRWRRWRSLKITTNRILLILYRDCGMNWPRTGIPVGFLFCMWLASSIWGEMMMIMPASTCIWLRNMLSWGIQGWRCRARPKLQFRKINFPLLLLFLRGAELLQLVDRDPKIREIIVWLRGVFINIKMRNRWITSKSWTLLDSWTRWRGTVVLRFYTNWQNKNLWRRRGIKNHHRWSTRNQLSS